MAPSCALWMSASPYAGMPRAQQVPSDAARIPAACARSAAGPSRWQCVGEQNHTLHLTGGHHHQVSQRRAGGIGRGTFLRPADASRLEGSRISGSRLAVAAEAPGKGFAKKPPPPPPKKPPTTPTTPFVPQGLTSEEKAEEAEDDVIPEVVTDRILKRLVLTVGMPLVLGLGFFPLFYYLKVVQKVDVPDWLPLISSVATFGLAGLGISYGVISTSWDPQREGTLLGWKEAKANWPVFTQTLSRKKP